MGDKVRIDFIERPWRLTLFGWVCLGAALLVSYQWSRYTLAGNERIERLAFLKQGLERDVARERPALKGSGTSAEQVRSVNQAIRRLNYPWNDVFAALGTAATPNVALLELVPEFASGVIRITAEARSMDAALSYPKRVAGYEAIRSAVLVKHELQAAGKAVRFVVEAQLKELP